MKKNQKGFTLVELLATIIVLAIVVGITVPLTLSGINRSKEKGLKILVKNITEATRNYATECGYSEEMCSSADANKIVTLSELVRLGFLANGSGCFDDEDNKTTNKGDKSSNSGNSQYCLFDPVNKTNLANCEVYIYDNGTAGFCAPPVGTNAPPNVCPILPEENPCRVLVMYND